KGSIGRAFAVRIRTENRDQAGICPFALREVSVLPEPALGHLRYRLTDVPPQSNSPSGNIPPGRPPTPLHRVSEATMKVVVFHRRRTRKPVSHLCYTSHVTPQCRTRVKLNRVFFPR
ncbi:hypothetical protein DAPPUDRAFT_67306, partial [Daphnia pulex]